MRREIFGAVAAVVVLVAVASAQDDGASRNWNQFRGNAARSAVVDVAPLMAQPQVAWRHELPGAAAASPICWEGTVFVVTRSEKNELTLSAVSAATGDPIATRALGRGESACVAVLRGAVFVVEPAQTRCLRLDGRQFTQTWTVKGNWAGHPAVAHDLLILPAANSVHLLDPTTGRDAMPEVAVGPSISPEDSSATCVVDLDPSTIEIVRLAGADGIYWVRVQGLGSKALKAYSTERVHGYDNRERNPVIAPFAGGWMVADVGELAQPGQAAPEGVLHVLSGRTSPIAAPPVIAREFVYAMSPDGSAFGTNARGDAFTVKPRDRSKTKSAASASGCRGVAYFGNCAVELDSGRVLWSLPDLAPSTPLIPTGDGRAVCVDQKNVLVGIAAPRIDGAAATVRPSTVGADAGADLPGDADGVLLADGRFLAGKTRAVESDHVKVKAPRCDERDLAPGEWALAQDGGGTLAVGEERTVLAAMEEILDRRSEATWDATFRRYADAPLVTDALRVLAAAKRDGLPEEHARRLEQLVVGKHDSPNADLQRKRLAVEERVLRDAYVDDVRAASKWCRARLLSGAATALLARVRAERPDDPSTAESARAMIPAGFPWTKSADAGARWIRWATEIVPAGGAFVPPGAPDAVRKRPEPWDSDVILLRTQNVLLVSRSTDPTIVGLCLRHAEGAIRACERVLGPASPDAADEPMEVRLHENHDAYLAEMTPETSRALEWSAGYFSPQERVSRFYVPGPDETAWTPLRRGLLRVLAHELTHQWIKLRWEPRGVDVPTIPGYWAVEGVAEFIGDQSVEMGRRAGRLDDSTVESLDISSQLEQRRWFISLPKLLATSQERFFRLTDEPSVQVQMRNTALVEKVGPRDLFYRESGALVFWLVNQRGPDGRAAFIDYLRRRYLGTVDRDGAKLLGAASADDLEREFRQFLAGLRK